MEERKLDFDIEWIIVKWLKSSILTCKVCLIEALNILKLKENYIKKRNKLKGSWRHQQNSTKKLE